MSSGYSYLDDGQINYQDSQEFKDAPVGTVELIIPATGNQPEQHIMLGDASQSIVIRSLTNSTVVSYVQNSLTDMLRNDKAAADAIHLYSLGQSGPAGFGNGGSSGLPPEFQPVIQENNVLPPPTGGGALGGGPLGSSGQQSNAPEVLPVIKPPTPPEAVPDSNSIIANPDSSAAGNVLTNDAVTGPGTTGVGSLTVINVQDADENQPVAAGSTSTTNFTVIHGLYGTLRIGADGSYNYEVNADNPTVKALGQGQSIQDDPFTYTVTDGTTTAQTTLTITVTGVNDAPVANADTNWAKEVTSGAIGNVLQTLAHNGAPSGSFSDNADTDVDNGTTLTVTNIQDANENLAVTAGTTSANGTVIHGLYGTLTIGANGSYSYVVDNSNPTVQALAEGQTLVDNAFTYTVTDGTTTTTAPLTITVFGTNDAPVASADTNWAKEDTSGAIGNVLQTLAHNGAPSGSFSDNADTDVDNGTTLTVTNIQDANENLAVTAGTTSANGTVIHGLYGTLTIGANGSYSYVVDNSNPTVQALAEGQTLVDNAFTYTVTDGTTTTTAPLTITVFGTNDAPVASADTNWAKEDTSGAIGNVLQTLAHNGAPSGSFSDNADTDVDNGTTLTVTNIQDANENLAVTAGTTSANGTVIHGLYGTLTIGANGSYSYVVDNSNPTVQALAEGQTLVDNAFTYTVTDGTTTTTAPLTITVFGTNDAPVASADTNWAKEDTSGAIGNVLQTLAHNGAPSGSFSDNADTDVDNGTTLTVTNIQDANENLAVTAGTTSANGTVIHGLYGTLTIGANGSYSYTPKDDIDNAAGVQDVFTYTVTDGSAPVTSTLTITVFDGAGPTHGNAITLNVDEAALSTAGATGSNPSSTAEIDSSALSFTAGSDSLTSFGFSSDLTGLVKDLNLDGTDDIFWLRLSDTQIKGYLDAGHTQTAVTLDLSAATIAAGAVGFATVTMTLSDNLKNPTGLGAQINSLGNVGVVATDRDGDSTTGAVNLTAKDDTPTATPANSSGTSVYPDTNLLITLDLSGSMDQASGTGGLTKLELAKQAILELIEQYDALGHVKVELVTFSDTAANASGGWVDLDNAAAKTALINSILGLSTSGSTNYDAALAMDMTAYNGSGKLATPGVQNVAYFLSDGEPTLGDGNTSALTNNSSSSSSDIGIQPAEETIWTTFVNNNNIDSFALGMGSAATQSSLNPIAYDGRGAGTNTNGQVVTDLSQLIGTLVATVNASPVSGDLISGGVVAKFGADGGQFKSLQVDNTTYTLNGTSISVTGGPDPAHTFSFDTNTGVLTVSTNAGGTIALDMQGADVGHYTYTPPASPSTTEVFNYTVMDGDGDTAGSSLTVTISPATTPPVVRDDFVVTNQTSVQLPDWVLLNNDTGPNSASQFISGVSQPANGDSVSHANGIVTYTDNNPAGGSFVYTDTAGSTSDTAKVTIARDTSGAIDGTFLNEILVGGTGNDTINGNEGNDILIGNGGTNTLNGGPGADIMSGGGGANTYLFASGDSPANVGGSGNSGTIAGFDVITDFSTTADKLSLPGTPVAVANSSGTNGTDSILTVGGQTVKSHAISNGIITFDDANTFSTPLSLTSAANVAAVVDYLQHNDIGNAGATVAFTATINSVNHTFIYEQVANSPNSANDILIDLSGTTVSNLSTLISGGHIDPIVLDLDTPGISFTSMANGVSFDINGDGVADHIAWTAGNDGFLAYDVNGNGTIDNGNELFTPNFAGGHFASGLAALASLDSNGDSVIDSADAAYAKLEVWQDTNHNGTADAGEMSSLADNGITAINLDGTPDNGTIDGQQLQAQGSFSNADGTTGSYVEVALDSTLGTPPTNAEVTLKQHLHGRR